MHEIVAKPLATRRRWAIGGLLSLMIVVNYLERSNLGIALPGIRHDLGLSNFQLGMVLSGFQWTYALAQVPMGLVVDRLRPRQVVLAAGLLWSILAAATGLAGSLIFLIIVRAGVGLAESPMFPAGIKVVNSWFPTREKATAIGAGGPGEGNRWLDPEIPLDSSVNVDWYIDVARQAEAARLDFIFIVDSQFITQDSPPHYLNRLEPLTLLSALAVATRHLGLVGTLTTSYNAPFNLARRLASLDLISRGRAGWNVVTSGDAGTAGNYSRAEHYDYDTRYALAEESVAVIKGLWKSYEDGAFPRDRASGVFLDKSKLHALHHKGRFHQVVGPLNIARSPQGEPIIFQAGDSEQGRNLGAVIADAIFTFAPTLEDGQKFYREIKSRAAAHGRDPDHIRIIPGARVFVGDTDEQAREIERDTHYSDHSFELALGEFGRPFGWHDFRQYDLDAPFPVAALQHAARSFYTQAKQITDIAVARNLTLRQIVELTRASRPGPFVGTGETVARELIRWRDAEALDGITLFHGHPAQFRRFTEEVIPVLQELGAFRRDYETTTLRGNLGLPSIPNIRASSA